MATETAFFLANHSTVMQSCTTVAMPFCAITLARRQCVALVGLKRASELTGKNQSTIHRAMKSGRISYSTNDSGERLVDTAELHRVFPIHLAQNIEACKVAPELQSNDAQLHELRAQLEVERVKAGMLEARLKALEEDKADLKVDRDKWRVQAEQANLLLTDQREKQEQTPERKKSFWRKLFPPRFT
jgi:hypothetical protein